MKISQNVVAFSEYMNFNHSKASILQIHKVEATISNNFEGLAITYRSRLEKIWSGVPVVYYCAKS